MKTAKKYAPLDGNFFELLASVELRPLTEINREVREAHAKLLQLQKIILEKEKAENEKLQH